MSNQNDTVTGKRKPGPSKEKQKKELIIGIVMIGLALFGTFGVFEIMKFSYHTDTPLVVVTSGSMEPVISRGDLLVIKSIDAADIKNGTIENKEGDIILYDSHGVWPNPISEPIVHRVVGKFFNSTDSKYYFITKGDANPDTDPPDFAGAIERPVPEDKIIGVVIRIIPELGKVKIYLDESQLTVPLIILLGGLLVVSIIWDVTHPEDEDKGKQSKTSKKAQYIDSSLHESDKSEPEPKVNLGF